MIDDPVRAIETQWRGYRFRSRLEARWAVFFDSMKMDFSYELEGFQLSDKTRYLPDFYLPHIRTWAEVKPQPLSTVELWKCQKLCTATQQPVLFLDGPPDFRDYSGFVSVHLLDPEDFFGEILDFRLDIYQSNSSWYRSGHRLFCDPSDRLSEQRCSSDYRIAVYTSRAARFDGKD